MNKLLTASLVSVLTAISGCANNNTIENEKEIQKVANKASVELTKSRLPTTTSNVFIEDKAWIPVIKEYVPKESLWEAGKNPVDLRETFDNMSEFAGYISSKHGIKVELAPEVIQHDYDLASQSMTTTTATMSNPTTSMISDDLYKVSVQHTGDLAGLLNSVTAQKGFYWKVLKDETVRIYKYDSQTWRISSLLGNLTQADSIKNGESTASVNVSNLSVWDSFGNDVKSFLSQDGKVVVSEALGTISVTDTPSVLERVDNYIELQNKSLSKNILIDVQIFKVTLNDSDDYGLDWNMIYNTIGANSTGIAASLVNNTLLPSQATNLSLGIIGNSEWNGTSALVKALSTRGKVSTLTSKKQLTLNGQPAPFKAGKSRGYLKSSQVTIADGVATTSSEQDTIDYGLFLNVVPHVLDDSQELLLQLSLNISTLDSLEKVVSGNATYQTPEQSSHEMIQRVRLTSGDTLILTGFDSSELRSALGGVGKADNSWLGGSESSGEDRSMLVVVVKPTVGG